MRSYRFRLSLAVLALSFGAGCYSESRPSHIGDVAKDFSVQDSDRKNRFERVSGTGCGFELLGNLVSTLRGRAAILNEHAGTYKGKGSGSAGH